MLGSEIPRGHFHRKMAAACHDALPPDFWFVTSGGEPGPWNVQPYNESMEGRPLISGGGPSPQILKTGDQLWTNRTFACVQKGTYQDTPRGKG
jgi:hypothetical protein